MFKTPKNQSGHKSAGPVRPSLAGSDVTDAIVTIAREEK